jgi:hypothetical protein
LWRSARFSSSNKRVPEPRRSYSRLAFEVVKQGLTLFTNPFPQF